MKKSGTTERISKYVADGRSDWMQQVEYFEKNREWLDKSAEIAVRILSTLSRLSLSQKDLAERTGVTPQYINKVVKGSENLSLETICKIEKALKISLVEIPANEASLDISWVEEPAGFNFYYHLNKILIGRENLNYNPESTFRFQKESFNA
mgnify:FL=1